MQKNIETLFDILYNNKNTFVKRCYCNYTPPPTYKGILPMSSSCESTINQKNRSASPTRKIPNERNVNSNRNNMLYLSSSELINITSVFNITLLQNDSDLNISNIERGS
ncbi:hypothetical protein Glove_104g6 [Diversispora epigaea]|uniref:Uncharacterized protein n=1 Tax=Diversispora epigaea TaxID=1348612 RepID=A0A397J3E3_9GLOM|nr:hypothetical protein Glove_104g6 [Diversispora epigaea]